MGEQNVGVAWFGVANGDLVLDRIDSPTHLVKLNPVWLAAQGYGHHVEDAGATVRVGEHMFRRVQVLREPFAAYELTAESTSTVESEEDARDDENPPQT